MATGTNIQLVFNPSTNGYSTADHGRECDFDKEHGKVSRKERPLLPAFMQPCASTQCHSAQPAAFTFSTYCRHTKYCRHLFWYSSGLDSKFPSFFERLCDLKRIKEQAHNTRVCVYTLYIYNLLLSLNCKLQRTKAVFVWACRTKKYGLLILVQA